MAVEIKPFLPGKKKPLAGILSTLVSALATGLLIKSGVPADTAVLLGLVIASGLLGWLGLEGVKDIAREIRSPLPKK